MSATEDLEKEGSYTGDAEQQQHLSHLQKLRQSAKYEVESLREVLRQATKSRVKLQLEAAMLARIRETAQKNSSTLDLRLKKEEGDAAMETVTQQAELAAYDQHAHVLEVQGALETESHNAYTKELLEAADKQFQEALAKAQSRTKAFQALTQREAAETREEVEVLKKSLDQHLAKLQETFEKNTEDLQAQCQAELKELEDSLNLKERVAIHEVEEQKNSHINALKSFNEETLGKLKAYYEDITRDNLQLVKKLRTENERTAANNRRLRKEIETLSAQNARIREPLQQQEALKARLKIQLRFVEKDKLVLRNLRRRNEQMEERIKVARLEVRNLEHQKKATKQSIGQLQQCLKLLPEEGSAGAMARGALLRLRTTVKLGDLSSQLRRIESAQLCSGKYQPVPSESASAVCKVIQNAILDHHYSEADLQKQLRQSIAAYNDMLVFMLSRLEALGVSHSSIQAKPLMLHKGVVTVSSEEETVSETEACASAGAAGCPKYESSMDYAPDTTENAFKESEGVDAVWEASTQPHGSTVTWPCAKGVTSIHLGEDTLLLLSNGASQSRQKYLK